MASRFYVYSLKRGRLAEPHGPYNARTARSYARIAASRGRHARAVTRGPRGRIARVYQSGTGAPLYVGELGFDPYPFVAFLTALHAERTVPPGWSRQKHGRGLHGEPATLYVYPNRDVYVLPDASQLSGYRVPGGSKDLDVSGTDQRYFFFYLSGAQKVAFIPDDANAVQTVAFQLRAETGDWTSMLRAWKYRDGAWRKLLSPADNWGRGLTAP